MAVKITGLPDDEDAQRKAFREKDALKHLAHPNIVRCVPGLRVKHTPVRQARIVMLSATVRGGNYILILFLGLERTVSKVPERDRHSVVRRLS